LNPGWLAHVVHLLAKEYGWSEKAIIWEIPLARSLQYYHCALQAANLWTLEPDGSSEKITESEIKNLLSFVVDAEDDDDE